MYIYICIFFAYLASSLAQQQFLIGTGNGILTLVGGNLQSIAWNPSSYGTGTQLWSITPGPNGSDIFISSTNKVWDAQGYKSDPGTPILLYSGKTASMDTSNQRWIWTATHQIYSAMNPSAYVTLLANGSLELNVAQKNFKNQIFTPVDPTRITATIRNYLPSTSAYVSVSSPFGSYSSGNARYQTLSVLRGFVINAVDQNGALLIPARPIGKEDVNGSTIVIGTPLFPNGTRSWVVYRYNAQGVAVQKYQCNMTFSGNKVWGTAQEVTVVYNATRKANETVLSAPLTISGFYLADGTVNIYISLVDYYQGIEYNGIFFYQSSTSMTIKGEWGDMDPRNYASVGQFEFTFQK